ncbi:MAG: hypothetical protein CMI36_13220 [Owenweeksia sp.]|nr:hypothetical protein [Owenweeksia sp.]MBF99948.1 hypothetical protein [Owenweeksia sp.]
MKNYSFLFFGMLVLQACTASQNLPKTTDPYFQGAERCFKDSENRIGALCNDSTYSKTVGSGACSHHGGVKVWLCK